MNIPWKMLADHRLTRFDLLVYATIQLTSPSSIKLLVNATMSSKTQVLLSLDRLVKSGRIRAINETYTVTLRKRSTLTRSIALTRARAGSGDPDPEIQKDPEDQIKIMIPQKESVGVVLTRADSRCPPEDGRARSVRTKATESLQLAEASEIWDDYSLLGLFYKLYETEIGSSYTMISSNARVDLAHVKVLVSVLGSLAIFAIRAFFSPNLTWIRNKRLDFFSSENVERFIRPVAYAMSQTDKRKPEWSNGHSSEGGLLHVPKE